MISRQVRAIICDSCGKVGPADYRGYGVSDGLRETATKSGWLIGKRGRMKTEYCPDCSKFAPDCVRRGPPATGRNARAERVGESQHHQGGSDVSNIIDSRQAWPFPAITEARKTPGAWVEISEAHADQLLEAVPPIYIPGGFMVSEPASHDHDDMPILCAVVKYTGRYYAREMRRDLGGSAIVLVRAALEVLTARAGWTA